MEIEKELLERAIATIENCPGFDDNSTGAGQAWEIVRNEIDRLKRGNMAEQKDNFELSNITQDDVFAEPCSKCAHRYKMLDEEPCMECKWRESGINKGSGECDECDGSGMYYINGQPQKCICSEPQR